MEKRFLIFSILVALVFGLAWNLLKIHPVLQMHVLDIGQGDAILLTTPEQHHILVDGGPDAKVLEELGTVLPLWRKTIDLLVLTHPHADHVNGLVAVLDRFEVGGILLSGAEYKNDAYAAFLAKALEQGVPIYVARSDEDFTFGTTKLDVLFPFAPATGEDFDNVNNASVVIRVTQGEHEILLTGDAEMEVEADLLAAGEDLSADVLKAGHHGSRTSSTLEFLEEVGPQLMVISAGLLNDYGHPHEETLQKAEDMEIPVLWTGRDGCISVYFGEGEDFYASSCRWIFAPKWRSFSSSPS